MANLIGEKIGEFVVAERVAVGGSSDVYRAFQPALQRWVALKVLRVEEAKARTILRFEREARIASMVDHPLSAHVYAHGWHDGVPWIAMEYLRGIPLQVWMRERNAIPFDRFLDFFEALARVVHHLHERGIIHRDLKPANIVVVAVVSEMLPKLIDLGIAKVHGETVESAALSHEQAVETTGDPASTVSDVITARDQPLGSAIYMPPEQWRQPSAVVPASDVYALATILYEAIKGRPPFKTDSLREYQRLHLYGAVPSIGGELARDLDPIFRRALAKDPEDRYQSPLELISELRKAQVARLTRRVRRFRLLLTCLAGSSAAAVLCGISFVILQHITQMRADFAEERALVTQRQAEDAKTQAEVEKGKAALLPRDTNPARYFANAYQRGDHSFDTSFMLARSLQSRASQLALFQGAGRAWSASYYPDNQRIVATDDQGVHVLDAAHLSLLFDLPVSGEVYQALYTQDQKLVTVSRDSVRLWTPDGQSLGELAAPRNAPLDYYIAASRGDFIAAIDSRGATVHVWNESTGARLELSAAPAEFPCIAFSADGHWLAVSGGESAQVYDTSRWVSVLTIPEPVISMAFAPTGSRLLTGTMAGDVSIWNVARGDRASMSEESAAVFAVAWSPDGRYVAAGREDGKQQLWRVGTRLPQSEIHARDAKIEALEFDATSHLVVAAGADGAAVIVDVAAGQPVAVLEGPTSPMRSAHFDATSKRVLSTAWNGAVRLWDASPQYLRWRSPAIDKACKLVTSSDSTSPIIVVACKDHPTMVWDTSAGTLVARLPEVRNTSKVTGGLVAPALSDDASHVAIAVDDSVEVYDLATAQRVRTVTHAAHVSAVTFVGNDLLSGALDGSLILARSEQLINLRFSLGGIDTVADLHNGQMVSIDSERQLRIYDVAGAVVGELELPVRAAMLHAHGTKAVVIPSFMAKVEPPVLIDLASRHIVARLEGHRGRVSVARWDGDQVLTSAGDGTARRWDGTNGDLIAEYRVSSRMVLDVAMANGLVLTADVDGRLHFSDAQTHSHLWTLQAHQAPIVRIHVERDEIVTVGYNGEVARWNIPKFEQIIRACGSLARCVTMEP